MGGKPRFKAAVFTRVEYYLGNNYNSVWSTADACLGRGAKVAEKEQNNLRRQLAESEVALRGLREAKELAEDIFNTVREPLLVLDADLRVISANRSFYQTFKVAPEETEGQLIYDLGNRQWDLSLIHI